MKFSRIHLIIWSMLLMTAVGVTNCEDQEAPGITAPTLNLSDVQLTGYNTATLNGTIAFNGDTHIKEYGFIYSTVSGVPEEGSTIVPVRTGSLPGSFSANLTGLVAGTTYYYCIYASNGYSTKRSGVSHFVTQAAKAPQFSETTCMAVGDSTATVQATLLDNGGADLNVCGFCYKLDDGKYPTEQDDDAVIVALDGNTLTATLTGLLPDQTYAIRAYGRNSLVDETGYGENSQFTTIPANVPSLSATSYSDLTPTSIMLSASVVDSGSRAVTEAGFCWTAENVDPTTAHNKVIVDDLSTLTTTLEGLSPGTTYRIRAYAINGIGTGYGEVLKVTTESIVAPTLSAITETASTDVSISVEAQVLTTGRAEITRTGFCWSSDNSTPVIDMSHQDCEAIDGKFGCTISGLNPHTTYHIRAYAVNAGNQTGYSETYIFNTGGDIRVTAQDAAHITDISASLSGEIESASGVVIAHKGFYYGMSSNPVSDGTRVTDTSSGYSIVIDLNDLEIGVTYYYCAFAESNTGHSGYSEVKSFTTTITLPTFGSPSASTIRDKSAKVSVDVNNGVSLNHYGYELSTSALPEGQFGSGSTLVYGTGYSCYSFTADLTDLQPNTTYYLRAWGARGKTNGNDGTINPATVDLRYYAFSETVTFTTDEEYIAPTLGSVTASNITATYMDLAASVTGNGNSEITEYGFCYTTDSSNPPTIDDDTSVSGWGNSSSSFSYTGRLSSLSPDTTYYIRAYAKNAYAVGYSETIAVKTFHSAPAIDDNPSPGM